MVMKLLQLASILTIAISVALKGKCRLSNFDLRITENFVFLCNRSKLQYLIVERISFMVRFNKSPLNFGCQCCHR